MYYDQKPYKGKNPLVPIIILFAVAIIVGLLGFGRVNEQAPDETDDTGYSQESSETEES